MEHRTRRRPVVLEHKARPTDTRQTKTGERPEGQTEDESEKAKRIYIHFINRLMVKMSMESLERIFNASLNEIK